MSSSGFASTSFGPADAATPPTKASKKKTAVAPEPPTPVKTVARKPVAAKVKPEPPAAVESKPEETAVLPPPAKKAKVATPKAVAADTLVKETDAKKAPKKKVEKKEEQEEEQAAPLIDTPAKKATKKAPKDDSVKGPKRALAAFMFYSNAVRAQTREANPGLKITEVASMLGQQWKAMSDADKQPYVLMNEADKKRYEAEKAAAAN
jgi:hypothetical protein